MGRRVGVLHSGSIADRLVDLLRIDGGWLTCSGIAMELEEKEASVSRTLYRLRRRALIQDRRIAYRREWRHVDDR